MHLHAFLQPRAGAPRQQAQLSIHSKIAQITPPPGGIEAAEPEIRTLFGFSGNNCEHFTRPHGSSHSSAPQIMSCVNSIAGQIPDHSVTQPQRSCATFAVPTQPHCDCHERCCPPRSGHIDRSVESCGENLAGVVRLTANIDNLFAVLATAGIRLIQRGC